MSRLYLIGDESTFDDKLALGRCAIIADFIFAPPWSTVETMAFCLDGRPRRNGAVDESIVASTAKGLGDGWVSPTRIGTIVHGRHRGRSVVDHTRLARTLSREGRRRILDPGSSTYDDWISQNVYGLVIVVGGYSLLRLSDLERGVIGLSM